MKLVMVICRTSKLMFALTCAIPILKEMPVLSTTDPFLIFRQIGEPVYIIRICGVTL